MLFQEGGRTLQTIPSLLFQPLWVRRKEYAGVEVNISLALILESLFIYGKTFFAVVIGGALWIFGTLLLQSASFPVVKGPDQVTYELHVAFQVSPLASRTDKCAGDSDCNDAFPCR